MDNKYTWRAAVAFSLKQRFVLRYQSVVSVTTASAITPGAPSLPLLTALSATL